MYLAYFGLAEGKQTRFASTEKDFKSAVCQQIPLLMKFSDVLMWQCHKECVAVSEKRLLLVQEQQTTVSHKHVQAHFTIIS